MSDVHRVVVELDVGKGKDDAIAMPSKSLATTAKQVADSVRKRSEVELSGAGKGHVVRYRVLDRVEQSLMHLEPACAIEYVGKVSSESIRRAFINVTSQVPILGATIVYAPDRGRYFFDIDNKLALDFVEIYGYEEDLHEWFYKAPRIQIGVARLLNVRNEEGGFLALQMNHAAGDARTIVSLLRLVWKQCGVVEARSGTIAAPESNPLPLSPEEILCKRWRGGGNEAGGESDRRIVGERGQFPIRVRSSLDDKTTCGLRRAAREHGTSVHGLVCGSIGVSIYRITVGNGLAHFSCGSLIDLRKRVSPALGELEVANLLSFCRTDEIIDANTSSTDLAGMVKRDIEESIKSKVNASARDEARVGGMNSVQLDVTNPGILPEFDSSSPAQIVDMFFINGIAYQKVVDMRPMIVCYTFGGSMSIIGIFPKSRFSINQAKQIFIEGKSELERLARE